MKLDKETRETIKMYQANDWEVDSDHETHVLMKRNSESFLKHILVFVLIGWWTFFIGNIVYHYLSVKKKKILK